MGKKQWAFDEFSAGAAGYPNSGRSYAANEPARQLVWAGIMCGRPPKAEDVKPITAASRVNLQSTALAADLPFGNGPINLGGIAVVAGTPGRPKPYVFRRPASF